MTLSCSAEIILDNSTKLAFRDSTVGVVQSTISEDIDNLISNLKTIYFFVLSSAVSKSASLKMISSRLSSSTAESSTASGTG